jgi:hypothetical protein
LGVNPKTKPEALPEEKKFKPKVKDDPCQGVDTPPPQSKKL